MQFLSNARARHQYAKLSLTTIFTCLLFSSTVNAGTLVRMNTPLGGITIELFDELAPNTVANFLNYVRSGRYNNTVIHRAPTDFVIQGGWLTFNAQTNSFSALTTDAPINNEFGISNTRGTVAMAKLPSDPNSATSQWFINRNDNTFLDNDNGGFTVFGRVVDNGMTVADAIGALTRYNLVTGLEPFPLINFSGSDLTNENLVRITTTVIENTSVQPNVYDAASDMLHTKIDAGSAGLISLSFSLYSLTPQVVIQALASSLATLPASTANIASFDLQTNRLTIPEFVVDGTAVFRNVVFELTDGDNLLFTLVSVE